MQRIRTENHFFQVKVEGTFYLPLPRRTLMFIRSLPEISCQLSQGAVQHLHLAPGMGRSTEQAAEQLLFPEFTEK